MPSSDNDTFDCECCGESTDINDHRRYEGDDLCEGCYDNRRDEEQESDDRSEYINDHDYRPMALFHNDNGRKTHQQVSIGSIPTLYFGIEVETESGSGSRSWEPSQGAEFITDACNQLVYCKSDGSLNHGFEIVTHPMSFGYVKNHADDLWSSLTTLRKHGFRSWSTSTCGLHIHISRNAFINERHAQKFMWFIYGGNPATMTEARQTAQLNHIESLKKFAGRDSHWSKFDRDSFLGTTYNGEDESGNSIYVEPTLFEIAKGVTKKGHPVNPQANERYLALNRNNRHTLELRFFRPSMRAETVLASIEFVQCMFDYTEQVTASQIMHQDALASFQMLGEYAITNRNKYSAFIARATKRGVFVDPTLPKDVIDTSGEE